MVAQRFSSVFKEQVVREVIEKDRAPQSCRPGRISCLQERA